MLYTLHSYIFRELAKVFTIAALSLTLVLSLGGLLQPLRQNGVSALQLFQLILYSFPMMMTFSLPVSALLAATLVYGRLSADNELIACRASGVSMWTLIDRLRISSSWPCRAASPPGRRGRNRRALPPPGPARRGRHS